MLILNSHAIIVPHFSVTEAWNYLDPALPVPAANAINTIFTTKTNIFLPRLVVNIFSLCLRDDAGTYRCTATRSYRGYSSYSGRRETVYMEVEFNPRYEDSYYGRNNYDDYFNRRYNSYDRPYSYAYAKTSEDTAVIDNAVDEKSTEDNESARQ